MPKIKEIRRAVITGLGALTPYGLGWQPFWNSIIKGKSCIGMIEAFDTSEFLVKIAGEIRNFNPTVFIDKREVKRMDPVSQYGLATSILALEDAKLEFPFISPVSERVAVIVGSGIGGFQTIEEEYRKLLERGPKAISPFTIPKIIPDITAGLISIKIKAEASNFAAVSACATSAHSIGMAFEVIRYGYADIAIAGGSEAAITPLAIAGFAAARALSRRNDEPRKASRPFDRDRDGFVMSEGAGIIILEELEHALARGAHIYAEILGLGMTADAYHITAPCPDGRGAARCMEQAIIGADLSIKDINYINAHGTSTFDGDISETNAIKLTFGDLADKVPISSIKSTLGHTLGAAGGLELIATCLTIEKGIIPATINLENPDPQCDLDHVPNVAREKEVEFALSNSFGFGGHNVCLVVGKYKGG